MLFRVLGKKLEAFGFVKTFDGRSRVEYQRRGGRSRNYTQKVVIVAKHGEDTVLTSYNPLIPDRDRGGFRAVALTSKELKLFLRVMRLLKIKNEVGNIGGLL